MSVSIYKERVVVWWLSAIMGAFAAVMLISLIYQETVGPMGDDPAPSIIYLILFVVFLFMTLNFSVLSIRVGEGDIVVGFGISRRRYPFSRIRGVRRDTLSAVSYGGWGIRIASFEGRSRLVVISLEGFRFDEFVLSTREPEDLMAIIESQGRLSRPFPDTL
jgi:hypothetical protein